VCWSRGGVVNGAPDADLAQLVRRSIDNAESIRAVDPRVQNGYLTSLGDVAGPKLFQTCEQGGRRPVSAGLRLQLREQEGMLFAEPTRPIWRK
jgi:hypothetical protein